MSTSTFAPWLRDQMRRREWNQTDLARRLDTHSSVISRWVRGERVPDTASCDRIADVFGLPVDDVLTLAGHRPATEPIRPDDPRAELIGLVKRVRLTPERVWLLRQQLQGMIEYDRKERGGLCAAALSRPP